MSEQKIIKAKLRKLLKDVDMDSATQRSIQKQVLNSYYNPMAL